jgi:hypothetical protein
MYKFSLSRIAMFCVVAAVSAIVALKSFKMVERPKVTVKTFEACKFSAPNNEQRGCKPASPSDATKVTETRHIN